MKNFLFSMVSLLILMLSTRDLHAQTPVRKKSRVQTAYRELNEKHFIENRNNSLGGYIPYWPGEYKLSSNPRTSIEQYFAAIPDATFRVEHINSEGNTVTVALTCTGTFKNNFMDWEATGRPFSYRSTQVLIFNNKGDVIDGQLLPDPALYLQ
jgi:predicted ester cyclase